MGLEIEHVSLKNKNFRSPVLRSLIRWRKGRRKSFYTLTQFCLYRRLFHFPLFRGFKGQLSGVGLALIVNNGELKTRAKFSSLCENIASNECHHTDYHTRGRKVYVIKLSFDMNKL